MMVVAPISRAPTDAHNPIGPCANTATVSPMHMAPLSAPEKPVNMTSGHKSMLIGAVEIYSAASLRGARSLQIASIAAFADVLSGLESPARRSHGKNIP
jgi:hypothetical protein